MTDVYKHEGLTCHAYTLPLGRWRRSGKYDWASEVSAGVSVAQWIARRTSNPEVVGSSPTGDGIFSFIV